MSIKTPITPPDHFIEWATDGGADKAEPSTARKWAGFYAGFDTDFNSELNYILNLATRWSKFNARVNAAELAYQNIDYTETSPFGTSFLAFHLTFDQNSSRWYCSTADASTNAAVNVYDSADGVTWGAAKEIVASGVNDENCTPCRSNGTYVGVAINDEFFLSTDNTTNSISTTPAGTFTSIDLVSDLIYDASHDRWFACGYDTAVTNGYVESSADGITWTQEVTSGRAMLSMAGDNAGNAVVTTDLAATNFWSATMQGAWNTTTTDPATIIITADWAPVPGLFVGTDSSNNIYFSEDGNNWIDTTYNFDDVYITPSFLFGIGSSNDSFSFSTPAIDRTSFNLDLHGILSEQSFQKYNGDTTVVGGQGKMVFLYDTDAKLAVARYGPDTE